MESPLGSCPWYLIVTLASSLPVLYYTFRVYFVNGVPCKSKRRLDGKTVIITGGNTGIGKEVALDLAKRGARLILACRNTAKGDAALKQIKQESGNKRVIVKRLNLSSCKSIREFSSAILKEEPQIDVLICNAGIWFAPYALTEDGFESTFGINHLGHFLLTNLLLERIKKSSPSRIVVVSSTSHYSGHLDFNDMMWKNQYSPRLSYCRSKLANVMFARELAKRVAGTGVTVCSLHPGVVHTEISRHFLSGWLIMLKPLAHFVLYLISKTPKQGAQTVIHCAVAPEVEGQDGAYYDTCAVTKPSRRAFDDEACKKLWDYSMKMVGLD